MATKQAFPIMLTGRVMVSCAFSYALGPPSKSRLSTKASCVSCETDAYVMDARMKRTQTNDRKIVRVAVVHDLRFHRHHRANT